METSRRQMLRMIGAACSSLALGGRGWAANSAGLSPGSFIWQASLAPSGPLVVTFSAEEELVRVFRAGVESGISTSRVAATRNAREWGVFSSDAGAGSTARSGSAPNSDFAWSGTLLSASSPSAATRVWPVVVLPDEFGALLQSGAEASGAVVALGSGVSNGQVIHGAMLLPAGVSMVSTKTIDDARGQPAPPDVVAPAHLVVSTRDRVVVVRRQGRPDLKGTISVRGEGPVRGDFLLSLVDLGKSTDASRWLAIEFSAGSGSVDEVIGRISLEGSRVSPLKLASLLSPGSTILVTDGPLSPSGRQQRPQLLLAIRQAAVAAQPRRQRPRAHATRSPAPSAFAGLRPLKFFKDY